MTSWTACFPLKNPHYTTGRAIYFCLLPQFYNEHVIFYDFKGIKTYFNAELCTAHWFAQPLCTSLSRSETHTGTLTTDPPDWLKTTTHICLFAYKAGKRDLIASGYRRYMWGCILMLDVSWHAGHNKWKSCPLVKEATKMHFNARSEQGLWEEREWTKIVELWAR